MRASRSLTNRRICRSVDNVRFADMKDSDPNDPSEGFEP